MAVSLVHPDRTGPAPAARSRRPSVSGLTIGVLCALLGFALVAQVQSNRSDPAFTAAREGDLVQILSDLDSREERLRRETAELERTRAQLSSGTEGDAAALAEAERRAEQLGILAGTVPATGPGLVVVLRERNADRLGAETLLDAVQELRGAGAEAMQITSGGGRTVRVGASTYFVSGDAGVDVDGVSLTAPYTITVIGDPGTLDVALKIAGGLADTVRGQGGDVQIEQRDSVEVTALRQLSAPDYARPAS